MKKLLDIVDRSGRKIINNRDPVAPFQMIGNQMRAYKPCAASDKNMHNKAPVLSEKNYKSTMAAPSTHSGQLTCCYHLQKQRNYFRVKMCSG